MIHVLSQCKHTDARVITTNNNQDTCVATAKESWFPRLVMTQASRFYKCDYCVVATQESRICCVIMTQEWWCLCCYGAWVMILALQQRKSWLWCHTNTSIMIIARCNATGLVIFALYQYKHRYFCVVLTQASWCLCCCGTRIMSPVSLQRARVTTLALYPRKHNHDCWNHARIMLHLLRLCKIWFVVSAVMRCSPRRQILGWYACIKSKGYPKLPLTFNVLEWFQK